MKELKPFVYLRNYQVFIERLERQLKASPFPIVFQMLREEYELRPQALDYRAISYIRYKVFSKDYDWLGYLDFSPYINTYAGNHYFEIRNDGQSSKEGGEQSTKFKSFDFIMKQITNKEYRLVQTKNYGKYGDPSSYDIWTLVPITITGFDIYRGYDIGLTSLCLVWDCKLPDRVEFDSKLVESAKQLHRRATLALEDPIKFSLLKEAKLVPLFDEMRTFIHYVYSSPYYRLRGLKIKR